MYSNIEENKALNYINEKSKYFSRFKDIREVDENLFNDIKALDVNDLKKLKKELEESGLVGSIRILRYVIFKRLNEINTSSDLAEIINETIKEYNKRNTNYFKKYIEDSSLFKQIEKIITEKEEKDSFRNWGAYYRLLFPFVYSLEEKEKIWNYQRILINSILKRLNLQDTYECNSSNIIKSFYGFEGPSNYGSKRAVIMIHPKKIPDHKKSVQLVCYFSENQIECGVDIGWSLRADKEALEKINVRDDFRVVREIDADFEELIGVLKEHLSDVLKYNEILIEHYKETDKLNKIISEKNAEDDEESNIFDDKENEFTKDEDSTIEETTICIKQVDSNHDSFDREADAMAYADLINNLKNKPPINIGIFGKWGQGKTHFIGLIKKHCNNNILVIDYDAWKYNDEKYIWTSLIARFYEKCTYRLYLTKTVPKFLLKFVFIYLLFLIAVKYQPLFFENFKFYLENDWLFSLFLTFFSIITPGLFKDFNINADFLNKLKPNKYNEHLSFTKEIEEDFKSALEILTKNNKRILLCIDNLDRCSKENITVILDSICKFLNLCSGCKNTPEIVTIFAIDKEIAIEAINEKTNDDKKAEEYLDKIFTHTYVLPEINSIEDFIEKISPNDEFKEELQYIAREIQEIKKEIALRKIAVYLNNYLTKRSALIYRFGFKFVKGSVLEEFQKSFLEDIKNNLN